MPTSMIRTISGGAALLIVSACAGVSTPSGSALPSMNTSTHANGRRHHPASSAQSGTLFVADYGSNDIAILSTGVASAPLGLSARGKITDGVSQPEVLATDAAGDLFVGNAGDNTIKEYPNGSTTPSLTIKKIYNPQGLAVDSQGNVWVSQLQQPKDLFPVVDEYAYNSVNKTFAAQPAKTIIGSGRASLVFPHGLAFDSSGNLFIADGGHSGALLEVKSGSTSPSLVSLPPTAQPTMPGSSASAGFPGFVAAPLSVVVSGSGSSETLDVSDFGTGSVIGLTLGASKPIWQAWKAAAFPADAAVSWIGVDGNGFSYVSMIASGVSGSYSYIALVDPAGNATYQSAGAFGTTITVPEGLAFTTAGGGAAARAPMKRNVR